jgi:hypothetical protein
MERQNVTLSLPKDLLKEARHLAVEKGVSLSYLLTHYLEQVIRNDEAYVTAMKRVRRRLKKGMPMGTHGRVTWKREDLYER